MAQGHIQESCLTRTAANSTASLNCAPARKHYRIHRDRLIKAVDESSCLDASKPAASSHPACFCAHAGDMIVSKRSPAASPAGASAAAAPSCCGHAACAFERWRLWSPSGRPEGKPGGGGGGHQGVVFYEELARVGGVPAAADTPRGSPGRDALPACIQPLLQSGPAQTSSVVRLNTKRVGARAAKPVCSCGWAALQEVDYPSYCRSVSKPCLLCGSPASQLSADGLPVAVFHSALSEPLCLQQWRRAHPVISGPCLTWSLSSTRSASSRTSMLFCRNAQPACPARTPAIARRAPRVSN